MSRSRAAAVENTIGPKVGEGDGVPGSLDLEGERLGDAIGDPAVAEHALETIDKAVRTNKNLGRLTA
ncbi:MAG: hypothetical protein ABR507_10435 [Actinomycetota bacterium]|nr:hypothetical protein [Actinomycetota bacterium]